MGEIVTFKGFSKEYFIKLIETFIKYDKCKFVVQIKEGLHVLEILQKDPLIALRLDSNVHKNIYFYIKGINLQKFLGKFSVKNIFFLPKRKKDSKIEPVSFYALCLISKTELRKS